MLVETRNRWHTREMIQELHLKYPQGRIRLPGDYQFEDDLEIDSRRSPNSDLDLRNQAGEIVGAFSGRLLKHILQLLLP